MTKEKRRKLYRNDPEYRARQVQSASKSKAKRYARDPRERDLDDLRKAICRTRDSISYHLEFTAKLERRLIRLIGQRDKLMGELRKR